MYITDTIAAVSTPPGRGGISIIRLSGDDAITIADSVFFPRSGESLSDIGGYTARFGDFKKQGESLDTGVALVYREPRSYTGENTVELMCHGGEIVTAELLRAVLDAGARHAEGGEFTKRAFLNGKLSLTEAEAVADIISAGSRRGAAAANAAAKGSLYREAEALKKPLISATGHIAAWLDYPEEDVEPVDTNELIKEIEPVYNRLSQLLLGYERAGAALRGISAVIVGTPNVGKSTLLNLLAGCDRAIVTSVPGTTRDIIEVSVQLGKTAIVLSDTAGIHSTDDPVESAGIDLALDRIESCQLVLAVFDGSRPLTEDDRRVMDKTKNKRAVAVINKSDLQCLADCGEIEKVYAETIYISAKEPSAAAEIDAAVSRCMGLEDFDPNAPMLANERQRGAAAGACQQTELALSQLKEGVTLDVVQDTLFAALSELAQLSGENPSDAVINEVFSSFCVGK